MSETSVLNLVVTLIMSQRSPSLNSEIEHHNRAFVVGASMVLLLLSVRKPRSEETSSGRG